MNKKEIIDAIREQLDMTRKEAEGGLGEHPGYPQGGTGAG